MYWTPQKASTYDCLFNFIVGARGVGKTYGCKNMVIKQCIKNGSQFIYVRRYKEELKKIKTFFSDIAPAYPDHDFKVQGRDFLIDGTPAGYALSLSTAKINKSNSYPYVTNIIFDEFILDKGVYHYLNDEVVQFLELYETVARTRDVRVWFISNALTISNPYFIYFDVRLPYGGANFRKQGDILLEIVNQKEFRDFKKQTRFGRIIEGTRYSDYAIDNEFFRDDDCFIGKKPADSRYYFTIAWKGKDYGVWVSPMHGCMYISNDTDPSCRFNFALSLEDHQPNRIFLKGRVNPCIDKFISYYKNGCMRFETIQIKNACSDIIKNTL